jgi:hypothetical protein
MTSERVDLAADLATLKNVQLKVLAPRPVDVGLELLVADLMKRARELKDVSRGEVVGALVLAAARDYSALAELVVSYRRAKVHELLPDEKRQSGTRMLPPRTPGRPKRRS